MPIYEYRCPDCGHQFEEWQKMSEPPVTDCPECGKNNVSKLLSAPAFHLKGSGWYSDHYGLKGGGSDSAGSDGASADSSTPSGGSDSSSGSDSGGSSTSDSSSSTSSSDD